jgi:hypothetical protein
MDTSASECDPGLQMKTGFSTAAILLVLTCTAGCKPALPAASPEGDLQEIAASPAQGFNYPYILRMPASNGAPPGNFLLVEPNNSGSLSDDLAVHLRDAEELSRKGVGSFVSKALNVPLMMPVFPRLESQPLVYTHLLDRDTMLIHGGPLDRIDLQLLAMITDARAHLLTRGIAVHEKVLLTGFSASGSLSNRFTFLHPESVQAVASGGLNGLLMLPLEQLGGAALPFPLGLADFAQVAGSPFHPETWRRVPQLIYMGADDRNDAVQHDDGYSEEERKIVYSVIGENMQPDRWEHCQALYQAAAAKVTFRTYQGMGHGTNRKINTEVAEFLRSAMKPVAN